MSLPVGMSVDRINELIRFFGEHEKAALRAEKRGAMRSVLFDLPRRSVLGWQVKYEHEAGFLREVAAVVPPEELGRRMKIPGSRPYYLQLFLLMQDTLGARQQRMLELGLREGDPFPEERLEVHREIRGRSKDPDPVSSDLHVEEARGKLRYIQK